MGPGKDTPRYIGAHTAEKSVGGPQQATRDTTTNDKTKVTVTRLGYQHGGGAGSSKPQVHEATTELGDKIEEMIVSDRIVDSLFVYVTWEYGGSANLERIVKAQALRDNSENSYMMSKNKVEVNPAHSTRIELKEAPRTSLSDMKALEFTERAEIVQELVPKRILD